MSTRRAQTSIPTADQIADAERTCLDRRYTFNLAGALDQLLRERNTCGRVAMDYLLDGRTDWAMDMALDAEATRLAGLDYWALNRDLITNDDQRASRAAR